MSKRKGRLILTADNATGKTNFGQVPNTHAVQSLRKREQRIAINTNKSVTFKRMTFFHNLEGEGGVLWHVDFKFTIWFGLEGIA